MHTESIQKTCLASNVAALGAPRVRDVPNTAVLASTNPGIRRQSENRRIQINYVGSGNNSAFTYDGLGHIALIVETNGGSVTSTKQFVWSGRQMREARSSSGSVTAQYFLLGQTISGTGYIYTTDHLGSIREMSSLAGSLAAQYEYDPYGRTIKNLSLQSSDFQYAGYYCHAPSGLMLTATRNYNPALGRWISRDPIGERGGINLYAYVHEQPVQWTDPSGLDERHGGLSVDDTPLIEKPAPPGVDTQPDPSVNLPGNLRNNPYAYPGLHPELPCVHAPVLPCQDSNPPMPGTPGPDGSSNWKAPDGTVFTKGGRRICGTGPDRPQDHPPPPSTT